jgi:aminoglycoside phosphotransferase (APT) family kinase protein
MQAGERHMLKVRFRGKNITHLKKLPEQGFSNENYLFALEDKKYLLRKFKLQGRDRQLEFDLQKMAYKKGLAAEPLLLDLENGYMICEFLEGHHKEKLERAEISLMAQVLKTLHSLKIDHPLLDLKSEFSVLDESLKDAFEIIESTEKEIVLCHNDLNLKNCIFSTKGLKLIDWEFAGMNDRYFDLAAISVEFQLALLDEAYLLTLYFGRDGWNKKKFDAYKVIYKALCEKWFKENT